MHLALDGPAVRASLEGRIEEAQRVRKQMWEEAKVIHVLLYNSLVASLDRLACYLFQAAQEA